MKRFILFTIILATLAGGIQPAQAQVKISDLTEATVLQDLMLFVIVWDSSGTMVSRKVEWETMLAAFQAIDSTYVWLKADRVYADTVSEHSSSTTLYFSAPDSFKWSGSDLDYYFDQANDFVIYDADGLTTPRFKLEGEGNGMVVGPSITFYANDGTPSDQQLIGLFTVSGNDDAAGAANYAQFEFVSDDVSNATEDGAIRFEVLVDGVARQPLIVGQDNLSSITKPQITINNNGINFDFVVHGQDSTMLDVDASANQATAGGDWVFNQYPQMPNEKWVPAMAFYSPDSASPTSGGFLLDTLEVFTIQRQEFAVFDDGDSYYHGATYDWKLPKHFTAIDSIAFIGYAPSITDGDSTQFGVTFAPVAVGETITSIGFTGTSVAGWRISTAANDLERFSVTSGWPTLAANDWVMMQISRQKPAVSNATEDVGIFGMMIYWH